MIIIESGCFLLCLIDFTDNLKGPEQVFFENVIVISYDISRVYVIVNIQLNKKYEIFIIEVVLNRFINLKSNVIHTRLIYKICLHYYAFKRKHYDSFIIFAANILRVADLFRDIIVQQIECLDTNFLRIVSGFVLFSV